jgi:hypothetical protein
MSGVCRESSMRVQIRFNTEWEKTAGGEYKWRVIIDGRERLAKAVRIEAPCHTTEDLLPDGRRKWHLTVEAGRVLDEADQLRIVPAET